MLNERVGIVMSTMFFPGHVEISISRADSYLVEEFHDLHLESFLFIILGFIPLQRHLVLPVLPF